MESPAPRTPVPVTPPVRSHWIPRTRAGRWATGLFLVLMALAQPPAVHLADRTEPWVLGVPFLYAYLLAVYAGMIAVLIWAARAGRKRGSR